MEMWNTDIWAVEPEYSAHTDPLYLGIPFFLTLHQGRASGVYFNNTFRTRFDVGQQHPDELVFEAEGGDLDYFVISGPQVSDVCSRFTGLVGRAFLPPLWTLGYHQSRWSYAPDKEALAVVEEFRKRQIPLDGLWLDIDYMDGFRCFTWSPESFPHPSRFLARLRRLGVKTTAILDPGIKYQPEGGYAVFEEGLAAEHFVTEADGTTLYRGKVWPGEAVFPDFTRPATRRFWAEQVAELMQAGLRGVWLDMNEPADWQEGGFPLDSRFDGEGIPTDHREVHNVYALLMARATVEGQQLAAPQRRPFVLTRAGFAGIQSRSAVWTGDMMSNWENLAMAPAMLCNLGLSGVPFVGTDIGGFSGDPGPELFLRWMQLGAFSPFMRCHVREGAPRQEPWSFGPAIEAASRRAIELRYSFLPYVYGLMREAVLTGAPLVRPLFYEFPDEPAAVDQEDVFMMGPSLLVAPVLVEGARTKELRLPSGSWIDFASGQRHQGPGQATLAAPLDRVPLLVRGGSVIPRWSPLQYVGQHPADPLFLDCFPVADAPGSWHATVYLDDGETLAYQQGATFELPVVMSVTDSSVTLRLGPVVGAFEPSHTSYWLRIHQIDAPPRAVERDGMPLAPSASMESLTRSTGYRYEPLQGVVHLRVPRHEAATTLTLVRR